MTRLRLLSSETFSSLSVRNFRLFFAGQSISQVGNWLTLVAQALLVLKITGNGVAVGLLTAFQFAPVLLLGPWAGLVADRSDKRKLLMRVQMFAMAQSFALGALAFMDRPPVGAIYAIAFFGGVATAFDNAVDATTDNGDAATPIRTDPSARRRIVARSDNGDVTVRYP